MKSIAKLKWHKAKKQSPLIYMENFLSIPSPQKSPLSDFSDSLGHLLMHKITWDVAQMLTDTVQSHGGLVAWRCDAECACKGEELDGEGLLLGLEGDPCETNANAIFTSCLL